jgi:hypothetical protein
VDAERREGRRENEGAAQDLAPALVETTAERIREANIGVPMTDSCRVCALVECERPEDARAQLRDALMGRHDKLFGLDAEPRPAVVPESSPAYWQLPRRGVGTREVVPSKPASSGRRGRGPKVA